MAGDGGRPRKSVKVFKPRTSLFIHLFESNEYIRGFYNVCELQMVLFFAFVIVRDSFTAGRPYIDLSMEITLFGGPYQWGQFAVMESIQLAGCLAVYPLFMVWRQSFMIFGRLAHAPFILLYAMYVVGSWYAVFQVNQWLQLPPVFKVIATIEAMRITMKSYSFIRENAYKVLYPWDKDDRHGPALWYAGQMQPKVASFYQYFYFIFAPTMLYRDYYPRNEGRINWKYVIIYFIQFLMTIWYMSVVYRDFTFPRAYRPQELLNCYLSCLLSAFFMLILIHTCVLHSYLNMVSELTQFADRDFYHDWWTCASFSEYYRKWNTLIHDWIRTYIYHDFKAMFGNGMMAVFVTTFVSAFIHEYLLALSLGFASPMLIIEFAGLGAIFYIMKPLNIRRLSNFFVLFALSLGGANLLFYYQVEYAARIYCPEKLTVYNFFKPRMFDCYWQHMNS